MNIKEMTIAEIEARKLAIVEECENEGADLNALEEEMRSLNAEIEERANVEKQKAELRNAIANNEVITNTVEKKEDRTMENVVEVRSTKAYEDAYAEFIKTGKADECRALLSDTVSGGTVAVPTYVADKVAKAWEESKLLSLVGKSELAGVFEQTFEISGTEAVFHVEGASAVTEETLSLGTAKLIAQYAKKWIAVTDTVMSLRGRAFLDYIYDELTYKIVKVIEDTLIAKIIASPSTSTTSAPAVAVVNKALALDTIVVAEGSLADYAGECVVIANKSTISAIKALRMSANYALDPFDGCTVIEKNVIDAYASADEDDTYMIIGYPREGAHANFPNGESVEFIFDEITLATEDKVRVIGKELVGIGVVAQYAFVKVTKPASV